MSYAEADLLASLIYVMMGDERLGRAALRAVCADPECAERLRELLTREPGYWPIAARKQEGR